MRIPPVILYVLYILKRSKNFLYKKKKVVQYLIGYGYVRDHVF